MKFQARRSHQDLMMVEVVSLPMIVVVVVAVAVAVVVETFRRVDGSFLVFLMSLAF
jgi:hypothetical protein